MRRVLDRIAPSRGSTTVLLFLALLLAPLVARVALVVDAAPGAHVQDLRGVLSDVAVAGFATAIALVLGRRLRVLALAWVGLFGLVQFANYENVVELKSLASYLDLQFLTSRTFVLGSALAVSRPLVTGATLLASLALAWRGLRSPAPGAAFRCLIGGASLLLLHLLWPQIDRVAYWRQVNVVQYNATFAIQQNLTPELDGPRFPDPPTAMLDLLPELAGNLDGESVIPDGPRARNVIVIALESVSAAMIAPLASDHGYPPGELLDLPNLSALAREHRSYSTFIAQQRKTSRGMYTLLCGELPNLAPGTPKMTEHASGGWRTCLPRVMRDAGFQTVYIQGAPLAFMMKDRFMPRAGFERVHGHEFFDHAYARSHWGVDDRAILERTLDVVRELRTEDEPFFLTLLTVGTHHPFVFPADWERRATGRKRKALRYADFALGEFMAGLEQMGALEDTLILLTSDESRGMESDHPLRKLTAGALADRLSQSWGYLIVLDPAGSPAEIVREPYALSDIALSVVDYFGLADRGRHFFGRSVFRRYDTPRTLPFANTNYLRAAALGPDGQLVRCHVGLNTCERYEMPDGLFGSRNVKVASKPGDERVIELARRSVYRAAGHPERRDFDLVGSPIVELNEHANFASQIVHGGQHLDLPTDQWIEVVLDVEARGQPGAIQLSHYIRNSVSWQRNRDTRSRTHLSRVARLSNGDRFRLRYTIASSEDMQGIKCQLFAKPNRPGQYSLVFHEARISVRWGSGRPAEGTHVVYAEIVKPDGRRALIEGEAPPLDDPDDEKEP